MLKIDEAENVMAPLTQSGNLVSRCTPGTFQSNDTPMHYNT